MDGGLKIGELARRAGVTAKAIRFYERKRILPPATRAANGYGRLEFTSVPGEDALLEPLRSAAGLPKGARA